MKESENAVRERKTMAEEELWSGWNQVEKQVQKTTRRIRRNRNVEFKEKSRRSVKTTNNEAILERCLFDFLKE